eukprot:3575164-Ditylum_brightwellii.AAC.1
MSQKHLGFMTGQIELSEIAEGVEPLPPTVGKVCITPDSTSIGTSEHTSGKINIPTASIKDSVEEDLMQCKSRSKERGKAMHDVLPIM